MTGFMDELLNDLNIYAITVARMSGSEVEVTVKYALFDIALQHGAIALKIEEAAKQARSAQR